MKRACIKVTMHGSTQYQDYADWAETTIQDGDVAYEISERMLSGEVFEDNVTEPEFYATYEVVDADAFAVQRAAYAQRI